jgi:hypothetical protein
VVAMPPADLPPFPIKDGVTTDGDMPPPQINDSAAFEINPAVDLSGPVEKGLHVLRPLQKGGISSSAI